MKVSVAIITKNEEANIRGCIASCSWADEIVIIDSHSTDATVEIANSLGARVLKKQFSDYSTQKQFAVDSCQNDWVLSLDADERIEKDLYLALSTIDPSRIELAYTLNRINHFFGQKVNFSGWKSEQVVRLFNRKNRTSITGSFTRRSLDMIVQYLWAFVSCIILIEITSKYKKKSEIMLSWVRLRS